MFVKTPNLPQKAKTVLVSPLISEEMKENLKKYVDIIFCPIAKKMPSSVCDHPDCQLAHIGSNKFVVAPDCMEYMDLLPDSEIIIGTRSICSNYPHEAAYNIGWVGDKIFHNKKCTDEKITKLCGDKIINVSQGYSKCNICVVDENSIITEDSSIYEAAAAAGVSVLKITAGSVALRGYDYGFLGGSSGKPAKNILAFLGDITKHSDYEKIKEFCQIRGVELLSLSHEKLTDFGSIIPIYEE